MKKDELIYRYLDGQLKDDELHSFKTELAENTELQKIVTEKERLLQRFKELAVTPDLPGYFVETTVRFREKLDIPARTRFTGFRYAMPALASCVLTFFVFYFSQPEPSQKNQLQQELVKERESIINEYTLITNTDDIAVKDESISTTIDEAIQEHLSIDEKTAKVLTTELNISVDDLISQLSEEDLDQLIKDETNSKNLKE